MIKENELRIGNLVTDKWSKSKWPFKITSIGKIRCTYLGNQEFNAKYENIEPIELTEEWLIKFGFIRIDEIIFQKIINNQVLTFNLNEGVIFLEGSGTTGNLDDDYCFQIKKVKYVHQLQNLYFCLTGEELKIN